MIAGGHSSSTVDSETELPYRRGVGAVLFNRDGLVWIGRRIPKSGRALENEWQMPQGGIDDGEEPSDAVLRELIEETGAERAKIIAETRNWLTYDLPGDLRRVVWGGRFRGQAQKWFALQFEGTDTDFDLNRYDEPEFDSWRWAELSELPGLIVPFKKAIYECVVDEFSEIPLKVRSQP